ncbi:MAG: metallophosphoesterase [Flavobacteriales bacterium]|nr:metallophosphoesterase [Flavobacteriales bacterium]
MASRIIIFNAIALSFYFYAFWGFKHLIRGIDGRLGLGFQVAYWAICLLALVGMFFVMSRMRNAHFGFWDKVMLVLFFITLISAVLWSVFLLIDDVVRLFQWVGSQFFTSSSSHSSGISRKSFLVKSGALVAGGVGAALTYGVVKGSHKYRVVNQKLIIKNLPEALKGLKILQISDVHSGSFWNKQSVQQGIDLIKQQQADIIFFTGDIVNNRAYEMHEYIDIFNQIKAPHGVFAVMGNHDYGEYLIPFDLEENKKDIATVHEKLGWDLLMNENRILTINNEKLAIVGVENWGNKMHFQRYGDLNKALGDVDENWPTLLLSHDPSHWRGEVIPKFPQVDAMFSGHTHGMQFGIETGGFKWSPIKYIYKEWAGLYEEGNQKLYVNRGFGYLGFPGRFGIWPEITVFELA